jgi:hypothetical protein
MLSKHSAPLGVVGLEDAQDDPIRGLDRKHRKLMGKLGWEGSSTQNATRCNLTQSLRVVD